MEPYFIVYSTRLLIGSLIIESAAYCNKILLPPLFLDRTQKCQRIESFGYCYHLNTSLKQDGATISPAGKNEHLFGSRGPNTCQIC